MIYEILITIYAIMCTIAFFAVLSLLDKKCTCGKCPAVSTYRYCPYCGFKIKP